MPQGLNQFLYMRDQDKTYGRNRLKTSAYGRTPAFAADTSAAPRRDPGWDGPWVRLDQLRHFLCSPRESGLEYAD